MSARDQSGVVVWFTGLPSAGKSTLARVVEGLLREEGIRPIVLDSDEVRSLVLPDLGYDEESRQTFYRMLAGLAALLAGQGHTVLVAATANRRSHRQAARALAPRFIEVHVATPEAECRRRDTKGLYAREAAGALPLPGAGVPYEPPIDPELTARDGHDEGAAHEIVGQCLLATVH